MRLDRFKELIRHAFAGERVAATMRQASHG
jgi:hypothetical protein